ncbi:MAG: DUF1461 domain-containing protein [Bacillota bacterium]
MNRLNPTVLTHKSCERQHKVIRLAGFCLGILAGLALLTFTLLAGILWVSFDRSFYLEEFHKLDIPSATSMSQEELGKSVEALLQYFDGKLPSPQIEVRLGGKVVPLYTQRELLHLGDVAHLYAFSRTIIKGALFTFVGAVALAATLARNKAPCNVSWALGTCLLRAGGASLALLGICAIGSTVDFHGLFTLFHLASFANDLWLLDPTQHNLIRMFPEQFFLDAALRAGKASALACALVTALGYWLTRLNPPGRCSP